MKPIGFSSGLKQFSKLSFFFGLTLACQFLGSSTPAPVATEVITTLEPISTGPLPPAIIETVPLVGSEIPLTGSLTFYFNQPMDRDSVERALDGQPELAGIMEWEDDATLTFTPVTLWPPDTTLNITLRTTARALNGLILPEPVTLRYQTADYLRLAQELPEDGTNEVDPTSAIVAAFTRPVVPLGAEPESMAAAFTLVPPASGRGEWLNTSTYIFYPQPGLDGGRTYTASLAPDLMATSGVPLETPETWSFTTAFPRLVNVRPVLGSNFVILDPQIVLEFNQSMDAIYVEGGFGLFAPSGNSVAGEISWDDDFTKLTYTPLELLRRNTSYRIYLGSSARARGGTEIGTDFWSSFQTVPNLAVTNTEPSQGGEKLVYTGVKITFSAPLGVDDLMDYIDIEPNVDLSAFQIGRDLRLNGNYEAETDYTITISPEIFDRWGSTLDDEIALNFRTAPLDPNLYLNAYLGAGVLFINPAESRVSGQAVNISSVDVGVGSLELTEFIRLNGPDNYVTLDAYRPLDLQEWQQPLDIESNNSQTINVDLSPGSNLTPGIYWVSVQSAELIAQGRFPPFPFFAVVSNVHLTYKISATDVLVWALDMRDNSPLVGQTVIIYDQEGLLLNSGLTDSDGVFRAPIPDQTNIYDLSYAVLGNPGEETFSLTPSTWNNGISGYDFGYSTDAFPPKIKTYFYTDRPIYRPGDTVFFRGVVRQAYNGRYALPDLSSLPLVVYDGDFHELEEISLPISQFGTVQSSYILSDEADPGYYSIESEVDGRYSRVSFQVAEYRKPEIELQVEFLSDDIEVGETLFGELEARYFFDAPSGNTLLTWSLSTRTSRFSLPGYIIGPLDLGWTRRISPFSFSGYGFVDSGEGRTDPQGQYSVELPVEESQVTQSYSLEVTIVDESGFPVSGRAEATVHPTDFYIGVKPDSWIGRAEREMGFEVQAVDWEKESAGVRNLRSEFHRMEWVRSVDEESGFVVYVPEYTLVSSAGFSTGEDGRARLAFTPPEAGTYMLQVEGGGALTQAMIWVAGSGQVRWPTLPGNRIELTTDRDSYQPGDTAEIFIPNPLGEGTQALITIERGIVFSHRVVTLEDSGSTISVPLTSEEAPNVYVSVTLFNSAASGNADYRQGLVNLEVDPIDQILNVQLASQPARTGPGETVTFGVLVTDAAGTPVEGEFSLSVVDLAVLALADQNSLGIAQAFYGVQPLGVRTNIPLTASAEIAAELDEGGKGGGGGGEVPSIREDFEDTAYWNAEIITDVNGFAQVSVPLPDNLTTWQIEMRGITADTRVGQGQSEVVVTKDLLVRPVTPRFFVIGDHIQLAAVVHNNTSAEMDVVVSLQAAGFNLDDPNSTIQSVLVAAGGRARVEWWGTVQDVENVDLVFGVDGQGLSDLTRPNQGELPVLRYIAPQTFATAGTLDQGGERLELISLPRSFDPNSGALSLELAPSLAAALLEGLESLEQSPYDSTEQTVSRFLPNLEALRVIQDFGLSSPDLESRLDRTLDDSLERLSGRQNFDGGWGWWPGNRSDTYITSYVLFALARAKDAGINVKLGMFQDAVDFLVAGLTLPDTFSQTYQLNRLVFQVFALSEAGIDSPGVAVGLDQVRDQLDPWAQALLALSLEEQSPGNERSRTLISDLQATSVRSATGAHWEELESGYQNMSSTIFNSAVVTYALAQRDPASTVIPDAVRYLMAHRQATGGWHSSFATTWSSLALIETMRGTGELGGDFTFSASLNDISVASGQAGGSSQLNPVTATLGLENLLSDLPNALRIQRDSGAGRLYYTAFLNVSQPVELVNPLERGLSVRREYYPAETNCSETICSPIDIGKAGDLIIARLTLILPNNAFFLVLEDFIPAGTEILDTSLKTSQQGIEPQFNPRNPFEDGWGWWYFNSPLIRDAGISWTADFLPAGTYELTYVLVLVHPGEFHVLPASAWQLYFPEVQGNSAGTIFEVLP